MQRSLQIRSIESEVIDSISEFAPVRWQLGTHYFCSNFSSYAGSCPSTQLPQRKQVLGQRNIQEKTQVALELAVAAHVCTYQPAYTATTTSSVWLHSARAGWIHSYMLWLTSIN